MQEFAVWLPPAHLPVPRECRKIKRPPRLRRPRMQVTAQKSERRRVRVNLLPTNRKRPTRLTGSYRPLRFRQMKLAEEYSPDFLSFGNKDSQPQELPPR